MPTYMYKAATRNGVVVRNKIDASSKISLLKTLKSNGMIPIDIQQLKYERTNEKLARKKNITDVQNVMKTINTAQVGKTKVMTKREQVAVYINKSQKITTRDIIIFTQDFYVLKKANFNNIHALKSIIDNTENMSLQGILEDILAGVEAGENMYTTMEYYSNIFPYIYINMIKVGELSGSLSNSLQQAVKYLESSTKINKKIKSILIPNIIQFVGIFIMLIVGTLVAIPAIQGVFDSIGSDAKLNPVTLWFSGVVDTAIEYWYIPTILIILIIVGIVLYIRTPKGKYNYHLFKYKMPIFGKLIYALDFSRLMKAMLLNLKNGMRIQEALEVSKNVIQNYVMLAVIETSLNNLLIGTSWIEPFQEIGISNSMTTEMLKTGMQTDLVEMMEKLVEYMEIEIDNIIQKIVKILPDVVYSLVGIVLIFFVIVVLVPCIEVYMGNFAFSAYGL